MKNTKPIYLFLKAPGCPCGTILPSTRNFAVNACAEDKSRLQPWTLLDVTCLSLRYDCCRLRGAKLKPQLMKLDFMASQCLVWNNSLFFIKQIFQLCCALKTLSKIMFFDLIRLLLFEKRLSWQLNWNIAHRVKTQSSGKTRQPIRDCADWPQVWQLIQPEAVWDFEAFRSVCRNRILTSWSLNSREF